MPNRSSKEDPKEPNEIAFRVAEPASGKIEVTKPREKNPAAVELGRAGGLVGGKKRAEKLTAEQRSAIARKAAISRWRGNTDS